MTKAEIMERAKARRRALLVEFAKFVEDFNGTARDFALMKGMSSTNLCLILRKARRDAGPHTHRCQICRAEWINSCGADTASGSKRHHLERPGQLRPPAPLAKGEQDDHLVFPIRPLLCTSPLGRH